MTWQKPAVLWPDAELLATGLLRDALAGRPEPYAAGVYISNRVTDPRRPRMVTIRRDGGTATRERDRPRLSFRVWGETDQEATDLAALVRALVMTLPGSGGVLHVEHQSGPTDVPDKSGQPSRYLVIELHVRGRLL